MKCFALVVAVAGVAALAGAAPAAETADPAEVEVRGVVGESPHAYEGATDRALAKAVEQGGGVRMRRETGARDFVLVRDTILARATGYVRRYTVTRKEEVDGLYRVTLDATIARGAIVDDWGAIEMLLLRKGRPGVLVIARETPTGLPATGNAAEYRLRELYDKVGFDLVDDETVRTIPGLAALTARAGDDPAAAMEAAARAQADFAVIVNARVRAGAPHEVYGQAMTPATADLDLKVVAARSPHQLVSKSASARRLSADPGSAARDALQAAASDLAGAAIPEMLRDWARDLDQGTDILLVGRGIHTEVLNALVERLRRLDGVRMARVVFHEEATQSHVKVVTTVRPEALAVEIPDLSGRRLRVTGQTGQRIDIATDEAAVPAPARSPGGETPRPAPGEPAPAEGASDAAPPGTAPPAATPGGLVVPVVGAALGGAGVAVLATYVLKRRGAA